MKTILAAAMTLALHGPPGLGRAADDPAAVAPGRMLYGDPAVPDVSGLWLGSYIGPLGDTPQTPVEPQDRSYWAPWPAPLTPAYRKQADEIAAAAKAGRAIGDNGARCLPFGIMQMLTIGIRSKSCRPPATSASSPSARCPSSSGPTAAPIRRT